MSINLKILAGLLALMIMVFTTFISCKAQVKKEEERVLTETRSILNAYFDAKAVNSGKSLQNRILHTFYSKPWADSLLPSHRGKVRNFDLKTESDVVDFEAIFKLKDIQHLQASSRSFNFKSWSEVLRNKNIINNKKSGFLLSTPAFDTFYRYAIFYIESKGGGSLIVFKKEEGQWIYFASGLVWIE